MSMHDFVLGNDAKAIGSLVKMVRRLGIGESYYGITGDLRDNDPEAWADALSVDDALERGIKGLTSRGYLHRSMLPLALAPIDEADGDPSFGFINECEGMCGV